MNSLNSSTGLDLFIPIVSKKPIEFIDDTDDFTKRAETPDLLAKSTGKNINMLNRSIFNFSYGDITQMMPDLKYENEQVKEQPEEVTVKPNDIVKVPSPKPNDKIGKRARLLEKTCETLNCIFTDKKVETRHFELPGHELELTKCIVSKKFVGNEIYIAKLDILVAKGDELVSLINELRKSYQTKKRKEEKIKFVFKHTIKNLKKVYFNEHKLAFASENEPKFFTYYFHSSDELKQIPIDNFYDPLNTSYTLNPCYRTLSKKYLHLLFKCVTFREDFLNFVKNNLLTDYQSRVNKKFKKLFKKLRKRIRTAGNSKIADVIREFIAKFNENKRCKLPWVADEILSAITCFDEHVEYLLKID